MLPNTERVSEDVLSLPIYESLPGETVQRVALAIRRLAL
jgi:dTDP-4-amino-4,6-dideoxygalactose transaminase